MNSDTPTTVPAEGAGASASTRPLGSWLRAADRALSIEFARALDGEHLDRRDWMILSAIAGSVDIPPLSARIHRGGKRVRGLVDRGWLTSTDDGLQLTDAGRAAHEHLTGIVDGIRSRVIQAVGDDDYATTIASLEAITREFGGDVDERGGRMWGARRGFGPRRFGPHGHGFGPRPAHAHGHPFDGHPFDGHAQHGGHRCGPHGRRHDDGRPTGEQAYERGFTAGFAAGRAAADAA